MQCIEAIQARLFLSGYNIEEQKHLFFVHILSQTSTPS